LLRTKLLRDECVTQRNRCTAKWLCNKLLRDKAKPRRIAMSASGAGDQREGDVRRIVLDVPRLHGALLPGVPAGGAQIPRRLGFGAEALSLGAAPRTG
jgi:hypothetical protein